MAMKKCAAEHCEEMFESGRGRRKFCDLHRPTKKHGKAKAPGAPKAPKKEAEVLAYPVTLTEAQLDRFWSHLTIDEKGYAVQQVLDLQVASGA